MRPVHALMALWIAGCSCDADDRARDSGRPPPSAPAPRSLHTETVRDWLRAQAISATHFGAPVFYTWLGDEDEAQLRAGASICMTTQVPRAASLDEWLSRDTTGVAQGLRDAELDGRQRAWPSAWGGLRGWAYVAEVGTHLARVELRPESLIVVYDTRTTPPSVRFSTERGVRAPDAEARQVPRLWAAVLLIGWDRQDDGERTVWREYLLVNPAMIGRVSMGSIEIQNELRTERERLTQLAHDAPDSWNRLTTDELESAWESLPGSDATTARLFASVVRDARFVFEQGDLLDVAQRLTDTSAPFEWRTSLPSEPRPHFFDE